MSTDAVIDAAREVVGQMTDTVGRQPARFWTAVGDLRAAVEEMDDGRRYDPSEEHDHMRDDWRQDR